MSAILNRNLSENNEGRRLLGMLGDVTRRYLSKMRIRDSVEVVLGPPLTMRVGGLAGRRFGFRRMTKADGEGGRPTERRATERNCPPLLLSIIWESNVSPPRHSGEAFWGFGWRQGRASGRGEAETGREDA